MEQKLRRKEKQKSVHSFLTVKDHFFILTGSNCDQQFVSGFLFLWFENSNSLWASRHRVIHGVYDSSYKLTFGSGVRLKVQPGKIIIKLNIDKKNKNKSYNKHINIY